MSLLPKIFNSVILLHVLSVDERFLKGNLFFGGLHRCNRCNQTDRKKANQDILPIPGIVRWLMHFAPINKPLFPVLMKDSIRKSCSEKSD